MERNYLIKLKAMATNYGYTFLWIFWSDHVTFSLVIHFMLRIIMYLTIMRKMRDESDHDFLVMYHLTLIGLWLLIGNIVIKFIYH